MGYLYLLPAAGILLFLVSARKEPAEPGKRSNFLSDAFEKAGKRLLRMRPFAKICKRWIQKQTEDLPPGHSVFAAAEQRCVRCMAEMLLILLAGSLLAFAAWYVSKQDETVTALPRKEAGEGSILYELETEINGIRKQLPVTVNEKTYSSQERNRWFSYAKTHLGTLILGENTSLDAVTSDLHLIRTIPGSAIQVEWQSDHEELLSSSGTLQTEHLTETGTPVLLTAILRYGNYEERLELKVRVRKKALSGTEKDFEQLETEIQKKEAKGTEKAVYTLPSEINGVKVRYRIRKTDSAAVIMVLTLLLVLLMPLEEKSAAERKRKKKETQMLIEYPELVCALSLLLGAGMHITRAWERIALSYINRSNGKKISGCREEVIYTYRQLKSGMQNGAVFEAFGNRCGLAPYKKLGMLIHSNIRKGTADLSDLLKAEAAEAMAERKSAALQQSEAASEKLMLPMMLELMVMMGILLVPAFMSMNI